MAAILVATDRVYGGRVVSVWERGRRLSPSPTSGLVLQAQPAFLAVASARLEAASRITSSTNFGWESMGTWELLTS